MIYCPANCCSIDKSDIMPVLYWEREIRSLSVLGQFYASPQQGVSEVPYDNRADYNMIGLRVYNMLDHF